VVRCGHLTGTDCAELVTPDDEQCPAGHLIPTREAPQLPDGIATYIGPRRPRSVGREQVQYITLAANDREAVLARLTGRPNDVAISRRACEQCASHHGIEDSAARAELRLLVVTGAAAGHCHQTATGYWRVQHQKFVATLDPSATIVVAYSTRHYERTPSEVFAGVPSRFGQAVPTCPSGPPLELEQLRQAVVSAPVISERLINAWVHRYQCEPSVAAVTLTSKVVVAAAQGRWEQSPDHTWMLTHDSQVWRVAPDAPVIMATWPAPAPSAQSN